MPSVVRASSVMCVYAALPRLDPPSPSSSISLSPKSNGARSKREPGGGSPRPLRYSELSRTLAGVSQKMLTQTLRSLETDGLVTRTVFAEIPPRVQYELAPLGRSLLEPLGALTRWATEHMDEVRAARGALAS